MFYKHEKLEYQTGQRAKERERYFEHLLSLDIVAMSFINFIASSKQQFFTVHSSNFMFAALIMWLLLLKQLMHKNFRVKIAGKFA